MHPLPENLRHRTRLRATDLTPAWAVSPNLFRPAPSGMDTGVAAVRMTLVRHLDRLDPAAHEEIFQTAVNDPNPEVARLARRQAEGRGIARLAW